MSSEISVAYFSMEIGLDSAMPTYAGGLGILAGDTLRSAADMGIAMIAVTLLPRRGYFHQRIDGTGWQTEEPVSWSVDDYLEELPQRVSVEIEGRQVHVRCWRYIIKGQDDHSVPVYFLDTDLEENQEKDRTLTHYLYGGDQYYRLCQETVLGIGGIRMLRALGYDNVRRYHMNEGHASLLVLELYREAAAGNGKATVTDRHIEAVRRQCVFTTHTPVPAGHDKFPVHLVKSVLGDTSIFCERESQFCYEGELNLTYLALDNSHYINGVAKRHGEVSQQMYKNYQIDSITNGIHLGTWASTAFARVFDQHIPDWRTDNASLRYAISIPHEIIWKAHATAKRQLIEHVNRTMNAGMDKDVFTLGFARRATRYKRPALVFNNIDQLRAIVKARGPLQIIFAGKAHPRDQQGKEIIQRIHRIRQMLKDDVNIVYLEEYDMTVAKMLVAGVDVWLNTPQSPMEASGTSGMKAAINGVPSLSILDGWWIEGCIEGVTGWAIGEKDIEMQNHSDDEHDAGYIYDKLERVLMPLFYDKRDAFIDVMRNAIAINGSFFNTERMLAQYVSKAYFK